MNLGIKALMAKVEQAARDAGFSKARVLYKTNRFGELVIAVLIPPRYEHEWDETSESKR
jgi:hypothetical protein